MTEIVSGAEWVYVVIVLVVTFFMGYIAGKHEEERRVINLIEDHQKDDVPAEEALKRVKHAVLTGLRPKKPSR